MPRFVDIPKTFARISTPDIVTPLLSLDYVKDHIRVPRDVTDEDANILSWLAAAERMLENHTETAFREQVWRLKLKCLPTDGPFIRRDLLSVRLEILPIQSVTVHYYDRDNVLTELDSGEYELETDHTPPILLLDCALQDQLSRTKAFPFIVEVTAGTDTTDLNVPSTQPEAALAICQLVGHWYRFRECVGLAPTNDHPETYRIYSDLVDMIKWRLL